MNRHAVLVVVLGVPLLLLAGCPQTTPAEYIAGGTGNQATLAATPSVRVLSPTTSLSIAGGTPVEVNWAVTATTNFATVNIVFDPDQDPTNGNEIVAQTGLGITASNTVLDTSRLAAGTYSIGVFLIEKNAVTATGYAPGKIVVNQQTTFFFNSPRDNFTFDRTEQITPRFDVAWQLSDIDSTVSVQIFLDPDLTPNGNEVLLRTSNSQTGDSFSFNLPTKQFAAGTYHILAIVDDGVRQTPFYAPGSIKLLNRYAGFVDLRDLGKDGSDIPGATFQGFNPRDDNGSFVGSVRDVDGDGFSDIIMLSQFGKPLYEFNTQRSGIGEAYLVYGRAQRFSGEISVNSVGRLFRGEVFTGVPEAPDPIRPSRGIRSFTVLSDWDQDGVREFAFGLPFTDSVSEVGLDPDGYFRSGGVVVCAGSVLRPDFNFVGGQVIRLGLIGTEPHAPIKTNPMCGEGFYGPKAPAAGQGGGSTYFNWHLFDIGGLPANPADRLGCRISSNEFGDDFGEEIAAGDFDSLIMAAPNRDPAIGTMTNFGSGLSVPGGGVVSIYYCAVRAPFYPWTNIAAPPANGSFNYPGTPGHPDFDLLPHRGPYHYIVDDFRSFAGPGGFMQPASPGYVVDVDDQPTPPVGCQLVFDPAAPNPTSTTRFWSNIPNGRLSQVKGIDDFNGDGLNDILIGQPLANNGAGASYIVFGRLLGLVEGSELELGELSLPLNGSSPTPSRIFNGLRIVGSPGSRLGQSQDRVGDFNGDGLVDIVIGSPLTNNRKGGVAVLFGSRTLLNLTEVDIPFDEIASRGLGVNFVGETEEDLAGAAVVGIGDFDGDGLDDILIAAPNRSVQLDLDGDGQIDIDREQCGVVYLVYGSSKLSGTLNLSDVGTAALPGAVFIGRNSGDHLGAGLGQHGDRSVGIAGAGDVDGDGHRDLLMSSVSANPNGLVGAGEVYLIYGRGQ